MRLPKDYAAPKQEEAAVEYIWERKGCVQQRREPIVRCRDCRFFHIGTNTDSCGFTDKYAHPNGFCSWGERR